MQAYLIEKSLASQLFSETVETPDSILAYRHIICLTVILAVKFAQT